MLDDLSSYSLGDFLLFSQETYFRLFELYNQDVWPLHIPALLLGVALLGLMLRSDAKSARIALTILAFSWVWVAWAFHYERYATINPGATYFAALFALEAVLLLSFGVLRRGFITAAANTLTARIGQGMIVFAVFVQPWTGLLAGRTWAELSIFGLGPDPTVTATLGALLAFEGGLRWLLLAPPILWCLVASLTALAMGSVEWYAAATAGALGLGTEAWKAIRGGVTRNPPTCPRTR